MGNLADLALELSAGVGIVLALAAVLAFLALRQRYREKLRLYREISRAYEDLRRTQEQLLQSEKMAAVTQLISGVAHELNNPLTAILGYAQLLEQEVSTARGRDFTAKLFRQAQRTQRLVQNLQAFGRQRKPAKKQVDLRQILEDVLILRDYDFKQHNITVERQLTDVPTILADSSQMEQVFLNIIDNALDAMLEVASRGTLRVSLFPNGERVCVEIGDSGPGIHDLHRIFDPFYTTKDVGKGSGLGLSVCYGILKEHEGDIQASNQAQGGAVFRVSLPVSAEAATAENQPVAGEARQPQGGTLVADDEDAPAQ